MIVAYDWRLSVSQQFRLERVYHAQQFTYLFDSRGGEERPIDDFVGVQIRDVAIDHHRKTNIRAFRREQKYGYQAVARKLAVRQAIEEADDTR